MEKYQENETNTISMVFYNEINYCIAYLYTKREQTENNYDQHKRGKCI